MIVTISGLAGSGTSTVGKLLAKEFELKYICTGEIFREMAKEKGMSLEEFSKLTESDPSFDKKVDDTSVESAKQDNTLLDSRLAGWFVKDADVKVWLLADIGERAKRVGKRDSLSESEALERVNARQESEAKRYKEFYTIDLADLSIYDITINTSKWNAEEVSGIVSEAIRKWQKKRQE